jgi:16S rRNA (adenine1518-N6/adenine1519-N6)-dimethyltransferase
VRVRVPVRELARRHGVTPSKALGQHFLVDPNLARAIAHDADAGPGVRVVEIGAGLGSLTVALAEAGADEVVAIEFDRRLLPGLREAVDALPAVRVMQADATDLDWAAVAGEEPWIACGNLPYNVATPVLVGLLERSRAGRIVVMLQKEVGDRVIASPGDDAFGPLTLRVAYRGTARVTRPVPREVFWPRPGVGSVVVRIDRHEPPGGPGEGALWGLVEDAFAEPRKTIRNGLRRGGLSAAEADAVLAAAGVPAAARPASLGLEDYLAIAEARAR